MRDSGYLPRKNDKGNHYDGAQQVGVPGKMHGTAFNHIKALFDHDRVHSSDCGAGNTKYNAKQCNRDSVQEDADEETERNYRA